MSLLDTLKSLLQSHNLWAKKHLGQNFLIDEMALNTIVMAADLSAEETVIEVGPGTGFLTEKLLDRVVRLIAVEMDSDMVRILKDRFGSQSHFELHESDILNFRLDALNLSDYKVVANIPYYITSPLLKHFFQSHHRPSVMVLLVQKEVAQKVCGLTGKSMVTIATQVFGKPNLVDLVPSESFHPAPKVDSAILKIDVYDEPLVPAGQLKDFLRLVGFGFSQKRKKLRSSLGAGLRLKPAEMDAILQSIGIDLDLRAEDLEIGDWQVLLTKLEKLGKM